MVSLTLYVFIFTVYVGFCIVTIDTFTKKKGKNVVPYLYMFYLYYSLLMSYVILTIEQGNWLKWAVEVTMYMILCGIVSSFYYTQVVAKKLNRDIDFLEWGSRV